jgi:hypothetical protein
MISGTFGDINIWEDNAKGMTLIHLKQDDGGILTVDRGSLPEFIDYLKDLLVKDEGLGDIEDKMKDIGARLESLSDWERGFYDSVGKRISAAGVTGLSPKQIGIINRIHNDKVEHREE